jgi:hypothetical protein
MTKPNTKAAPKKASGTTGNKSTEKVSAKKPAIKAQTPKQLAAQVGSIMRGLDNSMVKIAKSQEQLKKETANAETLLKQAQNTVAAISNAAIGAPPAVKAAPQKVQPQKAAAKGSGTGPKKPAAKAAKKAAPASASTPAPGANTRPPPVIGRPKVREMAVAEIHAAGGRLDAAKVYKQAMAKWGYFSRQSLYNVLSDEATFKKAGEEYELVTATANKAPAQVGRDEADDFIEKSASRAPSGSAVAFVS